MDLVLFGADEGAFVDVGVDFYVGVVAELESILGKYECQSGDGGVMLLAHLL